MPPSQPTNGQPGFKSRFSLLTLLPSRHPPLHISQPQPLLPSELQLRSVPRYDTHLSSRHTSAGPSGNGRIISQYASPLTSYPETPMLPSEERGGSPAKCRRPPPIDLTRVRAAYPTEQAINGAPASREIDLGTPSTPSPISPFARSRPPVSPPILPPLPPALKKSKAKREAKAVVDDPFEIAVVESGHRYASWQGGKVDIRPGQVIPRGLVESHDSRQGQGERRNTIQGENPEEEGEVYDSVLQHVLLTPTYLRSSPSSTHHTISGRRGQRETMLEKAKRLSRFVPLLPRRDDPTARAVRDMREREGAEMDRFRRVGLQLGSRSALDLGSPVPKGGRSPGHIGEKEEMVGGAERRQYERYDVKDLRDVKGGALRKYAKAERRRECWGWGRTRRSKEEVAELPFMKRMFHKFRLLLLILLLVIAAIVLAAIFLTRKPASSTGSTPSPLDNSTNSANPAPTQSGSASASIPPSGSATTAAPAPSSTSRTLQTCLDLYTSSSTAPYPCSDCTPLLLGTTNDFTTPLVNGNSTGIGAALQYCTLMDVVAAGNRSGFEALGWTGKGACGWKGINCDPRGRVTDISLTYPNVPYRFPTTIGQIPTLTTFRIKGNSSIPSGPFPASIISPTLVTLDISDTALQGPIASIDFKPAQSLNTLYLANNPILGSGVPDLRTNGKLLTLAMTGQLLSNVTEANLPSSLTYLDLSYNSLSGQIPSFLSLSGLKTLYLESNQYSTSPSALPSALSDLKLNNNPSSRGEMPMGVCGSTLLGNCDLRNTGLGGAAGSANGTRSCGKCLF
ncbi:uncharacterized protein MKK02DRAFT_38401 [Dioszegia hungarica]|uniref:L domain-like protein n=1 Tax=Dioszegia hungarica TaxID=4972 RepID=A0AA38H4P3_9TREE|nr:uncharacterized protein MKK02DRAFT_38401 [Dioszegia hungarica]KAI9633745.1 hypothetical protein MKK02DRAFT_38401 [Dioszegia hungarica]